MGSHPSVSHPACVVAEPHWLQRPCSVTLDLRANDPSWFLPRSTQPREEFSRGKALPLTARQLGTGAVSLPLSIPRSHGVGRQARALPRSTAISQHGARAWQPGWLCQAGQSPALGLRRSSPTAQWLINRTRTQGLHHTWDPSLLTGDTCDEQEPPPYLSTVVSAVHGQAQLRWALRSPVQPCHTPRACHSHTPCCTGSTDALGLSIRT